MFPALSLNDAHIVNDRTLAASIRMFDGAAVFSFMLNKYGDFIYKHLMVRTENSIYESVPLFS